MDNKKIDVLDKDKECVKIDYELELGKGKDHIFILVAYEPLQIYIDFKALPQSAFLCALCDGIKFITSECGEKGKYKRTFVNSEWVLNKWGGDESLIIAIKKRIKMIKDDLPNKMKQFPRDENG